MPRGRARRRSPRSCRASTTRGRGACSIDGVDVRDVTRRSLRREVGVISQDPFLFSASVRDNIAFGVPDVDTGARRGGRARGAGARVHRGAAGRLRHGDRRARDHALGRPAPAARDRAGARDRPADPDPRRRDRLRRRDHGVADPGRPRRGDARPHHDRDRPPALDDLARRHGSSCSSTGGSSPRAPRPSCSRRAPSSARSTSSACFRRSGSRHEGLAGGLAPHGGARRRGRRLVVAPEPPPDRDAVRAGAAVSGAHRRRGRLAARVHARRARRRRCSRSSPSTRGSRRATCGSSPGSWSRSSSSGSSRSRSRRCRPTSRAGSASARSPTCGSGSSPTCSGSRSATSSATAPARSSAGSRTTSRRSTR